MHDSRRTIIRSGIAGIIASMAMGMVAMAASATYQQTGLFTPLYHIASLIASPDAMMRSVMAAQHGTAITFVAGPAAVGLMIHMVTGALFGVVFGLLSTRLPALSTGRSALVGAAYGVVVFAASAFVLLPAASVIANDTRAIDSMASIVGYPTFLAEHVVFGVVLALLSTVPLHRTAASPRARAVAAS